MGYAERSRQSLHVADAADDRQRAFTLLVKAYDQVRRAATFVRWENDDVEKYAPSLWAGRGGRGSSNSSEGGGKSEPPPPAEGSDSSTSEQGSQSGEQAEPPEQGSGADEGAAASEAQAAGEPDSLDPAQLLQGVRDREAERRAANERKARAQCRSAPVEKDW